LEEKMHSTNQKRKKRIEVLEKLMAEKNTLIEQNHVEMKVIHFLSNHTNTSKIENGNK
jgi:hypothetical protein